MIKNLSKVIETALETLPTAAISRAFGVLAEQRFPPNVQGTINRKFAEFAGINLDESEQPPEAYPSLNAFFTRKLKDGVHTVDAGPRDLVSPVDGKLSNFGPIEEGTLVQAKGREYTIGALLDGDRTVPRFAGGYYATIYLSPKDYHRIHTPVAGKVEGMGYVPGHLFPVNRIGVENVDSLFPRNERLTSFIETGDERLVAVVKVGATCVGRISVVYDDYHTNRDATRVAFRRDYPAPAPLDAGDELAMFNLGSTVVLLIEAGSGFAFESGLETGQSMRVGQPMGSWQ